MRQIILASGSPRRKDLLKQMGLEFEVIPSDFDEQLDDDRSPEEVAKELGLGKALTVAKQYPEAIVIGSDTIVTVNGKQLGKAADADEARAMLEMVCAGSNLITSSIAVVCLAENFEVVDAVNAKVYPKSFDAAKVEAYIRTDDWRDKAAAYGVQSGASFLVDYIDGRYDTVLGFPTERLAEILQQLGISARPADPTPPPELRFKQVQIAELGR